VDPRKAKVLLEGKFFSVILSHRNMTFSFSGPHDNRNEPLRDLHDFAGAVLALQEASVPGEALEVRILDGGRQLFKENLQPNGTISPEIIDFSRVVENAWVIAKHLDIHSHAEVRAPQLNVQKERLQLFRDLLSPELREFKIGFQEKAIGKLENARACVPLGTEVIIGGYRCLILISVWGNLTGADATERGIACMMKTHERKIELAYAALESEESAVSLNEAVRNFADSLDDSVNCIIFEHYTSGRKSPQLRAWGLGRPQRSTARPARG
jgi:hypothetical protein